MLIKTESVRKNYDGLQVLQEVNFELKENTISAIIGGSGSGKSTLLKIIGLLLKPDSGEVWLNDKKTVGLCNKEKSQLRLNHIGFVFQEFNLIGHLSTLENVMLPALFAGTPRSFAQKRAFELLERLGLSDKAQSLARNLSGGQEQRVAMARALVNQPAIIIADEPTANLDHRNKMLFLGLAQELNQTTGQSFLIVTHDKEVAGMASDVFVMEDGRLLKINN